MKSRLHQQRGQVLVVTALFMFVLIVSAALAVDYSTWLASRRDFQAVADAASLAGAAQLPATGYAAPTLTQQRNAAAEALVYLSNHLGWGSSFDRSWAEGQASGFLTAGGGVQQTAPLVVTAADGSTYCVWVWTPTPAGSETTGTNAACQPVGNILYAPPNFPNSNHKVFVRVVAPRPSFFGNIAGIHDELVGATAVAGSARLNYAVIALKPRLGTPDSQLGITIAGGSTLNVPVGDVGGNYSLSFGGSLSKINFPGFGLEQTVDLEEPGSISYASGTIVGGTVQQLTDYPIPDPAYFTPPPTYCTGPTSGICQEPLSSTLSPAAPGPIPYAPAAVYPACSTPAQVSQHTINCANADGTLTIYPGLYDTISVPAHTNVTLSPTCFPTDTDCIANGRAGVFYFHSTSSNAGFRVNGTPGSPTTVSGCGVLLIFDPYEIGGSRVQFNAGGNGNTININGGPGCTMRYDPGNPSSGTPFVWYGFNQPYQNPVSMWVRPNSTYSLTATNNGSNVITFTSGTTVNENGVVYAPQDNTTVSGGPSGSGVGQIVSWTITYTGGTTINESYQGPGIIRTRLWQ